MSGATSERLDFLRARLGSLFAVLPLGLWTILHLWHNLAAFRGGEAWSDAVTTYPHPIAQITTLIVVLAPLAVHTVWGIGRLLVVRPNNLRYRYYGNLKFALQRLSAVGVALFLGAHLWLALIHPRLVEGHAESFADISHEMHFHAPTLIVYLLGTFGTAYHLANGLAAFAMGWGVIASRRALKRVEWLVIAFFLVLLTMAWGAIYALYTAGT